MFQGTVIHVLPYERGLWQIKFESEQESHSVYGNKSTAVEVARGLAKDRLPCRLIVHKEDTSTEFESTYAGGPSAPRQ